VLNEKRVLSEGINVFSYNKRDQNTTASLKYCGDPIPSFFYEIKDD